MKSKPLKEKGRECFCNLLQRISVGGRRFWNNRNVQKLVVEGIKWVEYVSYIAYRMG
jgi:hypothetical protein